MNSGNKRDTPVGIRKQFQSALPGRQERKSGELPEVSGPSGNLQLAASKHSPARMAGDDRRLQILNVAVSLFSQNGFRGTTTKEIALASGVSEAMVFRHFATKKELYAAILDHKACANGSIDPKEMIANAIARKDDRGVFEGLAFGALERHESDPEFQRLLLYSALEGHELAEMFFESFVRRVYEFLGGYIRERQREGAFTKLDPAVIVRAFVGMMIHHSLNNNLWDPKRRLLDITNEAAAKHFADILLSGISRRPRARSARKMRHHATKVNHVRKK